MGQPIKKSRKKKPVEGVVEGIEFCNYCPFLGYQDDVYICNPNDYVFGKVKGNIPVPDWCGNKKIKKDEDR